MMLRAWCAIYHIVSVVQPLKQFRDLFRWVLQIVVQSDDSVVPRRPDAAEQGIVLAVIAHQVDAAQSLILATQVHDALPASIAAAVVHEDHLVRQVELLKHRREATHERAERQCAVVDRDDNRDRASALHKYSLRPSWSAILLALPGAHA